MDWRAVCKTLSIYIFKLRFIQQLLTIKIKSGHTVVTVRITSNNLKLNLLQKGTRYQIVLFGFARVSNVDYRISFIVERILKAVLVFVLVF